MIYSLEMMPEFKLLMSEPESPLRLELIAEIERQQGLGDAFIRSYLEFRLTGISAWRNIDGTRVSEGSYHWDYDLRLCQVTEVCAWTPDAKRNDPWHKTVVIQPDGYGRTGHFNGERLWSRHPASGRSADQAASEIATSM